MAFDVAQAVGGGASRPPRPASGAFTRAQVGPAARCCDTPRFRVALGCWAAMSVFMRRRSRCRHAPPGTTHPALQAPWPLRITTTCWASTAQQVTRTSRRPTTSWQRSITRTQTRCARASKVAATDQARGGAPLHSSQFGPWFPTAPAQRVASARLLCVSHAIGSRPCWAAASSLTGQHWHARAGRRRSRQEVPGGD
jgi:hypothetical protein